MATQFLSRTLLSKTPVSTKTLIASLLARTFSSSVAPPAAALRPSFLRSLSAAVNLTSARAVLTSSSRAFATRAASSSLNDQNPNWSNRPPKETILLDGCDFEHWLVVMEKPEGDPTRDEIIDSYIKTLAMVVGSEEEARMKIYSVSTRCYYAFGALVNEEVSLKIKELPRVRWVLPDSYLDVRNKDYGGEPFINGKAVPYDPKYHEEWERNNARAMERNRRNDRPRANDRSRNFNRRRENMQNQDFQTAQSPRMASQGMPNSAPNMGGYPQGSMGPPNPGSVPPSNGPQPGFHNPGMQQNMHGPGVPPPPNNYNIPQNNMGMQQPSNMGPPPSNPGWSNDMPGNRQQNFQNGPNNGGLPPYQGAPGNYQNGYNPSRDGSGPSGYPYSG